jgi:hypothetical protein
MDPVHHHLRQASVSVSHQVNYSQNPCPHRGIVALSIPVAVNSRHLQTNKIFQLVVTQDFKKKWKILFDAIFEESPSKDLSISPLSFQSPTPGISYTMTILSLPGQETKVAIRQLVTPPYVVAPNCAARIDRIVVLGSNLKSSCVFVKTWLNSAHYRDYFGAPEKESKDDRASQSSLSDNEDEIDEISANSIYSISSENSSTPSVSSQSKESEAEAESDSQEEDDTPTEQDDDEKLCLIRWFRLKSAVNVAHMRYLLASADPEGNVGEARKAYGEALANEIQAENRYMRCKQKSNNAARRWARPVQGYKAKDAIPGRLFRRP